MLVGLRPSGNSLQRKEPIRNENDLALQALFPLRQRLCPARELLRKFRSLGLPPLLFPALQGGRIKGGGLRVHLVLCPRRLPPEVEREGWVGGVSLDIRRCARAHLCLFSPTGAGEGEVARSQRTPPAHAASSVASPRSSQHARRRDESREVSEDRFFARSSRASRSSDRGARKDRRARSRSDSSRDCGRRSCSRSSYCSRSRASKAVILSVAVLPRAVAIFGLLPLSACALSFSGRSVSILGSIPVSPRPLSA